MNTKSIFIAAAAASLLVTSSGCKKDKETTAELLDGDWTITQYRVGGNDIVPEYYGYDVSMTFIFDEDGDFNQNLNISYTYDGQPYSYSYTFTGSWNSPSDSDLDLTFDANSEGVDEFEASPANNFAENEGADKLMENYEIIELTSSSMRLETTINNRIINVSATKQ